MKRPIKDEGERWRLDKILQRRAVRRCCSLSVRNHAWWHYTCIRYGFVFCFDFVMLCMRSCCVHLCQTYMLYNHVGCVRTTTCSTARTPTLLLLTTPASRSCLLTVVIILCFDIFCRKRVSKYSSCCTKKCSLRSASTASTRSKLCRVFTPTSKFVTF